MKLVIQRVATASLSVEGELFSKIGKGYFVLVGIGKEDTTKHADLLAEKLSKLRVMADDEGKMNLTVSNSKGEMLIVSQFTLLADTRGGNRPSFISAAPPEIARPLYEYFVKKVRSFGMKVETGKFGNDMKIDASLDGPVTILLEI